MSNIKSSARNQPTWIRFPVIWVVSLLLLPMLAIAQDDRVSKFYEDALVRFKAGDLPAAEVQLKNALQVNPRYLPGQLLLGKVQLQTGKVAEAEQAFKTAIRLGVDRSEIAPLLAQAYFDQAKFATLIESIEPAGLRPDAMVSVLIMHAYAHIETGQLLAANRALDEARKIQPTHTGIMIAQASIYLHQGQFAEAKKQADQLVTKMPKDAKAWHIRGATHHALGDAKTAITDYRQALSLEPNLGETRIARAALLIDQARYSEAVDDLERFSGLTAKDPRVTYLRAMAFAKLGKPEASRESLLEAARSIETIPVDILARRPQFLLIGGLTYAGLKQNEKSRLLLQRFVHVEPNHIGARKLLSAILIADRNYVKALSILEPFQNAYKDDAHFLALLATANSGANQPKAATRLLEQALSASQQSPDMRASLGYTLLGSGDLESGLDHLRQAFLSDPSKSQVGITLAVMELKRGNPKSAAEITHKLISQNPNNPLMQNLLGAIRARSGDLRGARSAYEKAISLDPKSEPPLLNLARLDRAEANPDAARLRLLQILANNPRQTQALYELALLDMAIGKAPEAIRHLEKMRALAPADMTAAATLLDLYVARKRWDRVITLAKELETQAGSHFNALAALGRAYFALNEKLKAISTLERMIPLAGNDTDKFVAIARQHAGIGNTAGAEQHLNKALTLHPNYFPAEAFLVELDISQGRLDKAEQRVAAMQSQAPNDPQLLKLQGDIALAKRNLPAAIHAYHNAYDKQKGADALFRLTQSLQLNGNHSKAIELLTQEAKKHPTNSLITRALAEANLRAGRLDAAQQGYEQLLKKDEKDIGALNNLAYIMTRVKRPEALGYAEKAYRLAPEDAAINDTLGWALLIGGKPDKALHYLREARLRDPGNGEIRYHLAVALHQLGKRVEAREELESALSGSPFEAIAEARALLNQLSRP